jgi:site-specific DNA-cytosine methylase
LSYTVATHVVNAADHGVPQRRHRWYIIATRQMCDPSQFQVNTASVIRDCRLPLPDLDAWLLPPDHPDVVTWLGVFRQQRSRSASSASWQDLHPTIFKERGLTWPPELDLATRKVLDEAVSNNSLTEREGDVLAFLLLTKCGADIVDLSQSIGRTPAGNKVTPTVMPAGLLFSLRQMRLLTPTDLCMLQGIPEGSTGSASSDIGTSRSSAPSWSLVADLSGNAFCGYCVAAALLASICYG